MNIQEYFKNNMTAEKCYAVVKTKDKEIPVYIFEYNGYCLDFPVLIIEKVKVDDNGEIMEELLERYEGDRRMIEEEFIKPMIVDGYYYELESPQTTGSALPNEADEIIMMSEPEMLRYLLAK